jgi:hypothetical protein
MTQLVLQQHTLVYGDMLADNDRFLQNHNDLLTRHARTIHVHNDAATQMIRHHQSTTKRKMMVVVELELDDVHKLVVCTYQSRLEYKFQAFHDHNCWVGELLDGCIHHLVVDL